MNKLLTAAAAVLTIATACTSTQKSETTMQQQPEEQQIQIHPLADKAIIIDVRTEQEFKDGHLKGALHMPYDHIGEILPPQFPDKNTPILLYCRSGNRSGKAMKTLQGLGYTNLDNIGAMPDAARRADRPIVK